MRTRKSDIYQNRNQIRMKGLIFLDLALTLLFASCVIGVALIILNGKENIMITRAIDEVCEEAIEYLDSAHERGQKISPWDIKGYFVEIKNLYKVGEDDLK